jgi:hypothetical protein
VLSLIHPALFLSKSIHPTSHPSTRHEINSECERFYFNGF